MSSQIINNNLNYLNNSTFIKGDRLFVLLLENEEDRISSSKYYTPIVKIKYFYVMIDGKNFFETPTKIKKKYTKILLKGKEVMTTQLIYWTMNIFQSIKN